MKKVIFQISVVVLSMVFSVNYATATAQPTEVSAAVLVDETPIYLDPESKTVFFDLKQLANKGVASEVVVKDTSGKIVMTKDLADASTDAVYELDMSQFKSGTYTVVLRTYSDEMQQIIELP